MAIDDLSEVEHVRFLFIAGGYNQVATTVGEERSVRLYKNISSCCPRVVHLPRFSLLKRRIDALQYFGLMGVHLVRVGTPLSNLLLYFVGVTNLLLSSQIGWVGSFYRLGQLF